MVVSDADGDSVEVDKNDKVPFSVASVDNV